MRAPLELIDTHEALVHWHPYNEDAMDGCGGREGCDVGARLGVLVSVPLRELESDQGLDSTRIFLFYLLYA